MTPATKSYISLAVCVLGTLMSLSGDLALLVSGTVLSVGGALGFYYYRFKSTKTVTQNEMEVNALLKVQEYKESQKNQPPKVPN